MEFLSSAIFQGPNPHSNLPTASHKNIDPRELDRPFAGAWKSNFYIVNFIKKELEKNIILMSTNSKKYNSKNQNAYFFQCTSNLEV